MGEVSLAVHRAQGVEVAIKILHGTTAKDPWAVEAFHNEVRAVAALSHPGIVSVIDHGVVEADSGLVSLGHFLAGTPYLVMEYVKGRPMNRFVGRLSWNQIRAVLLQLLDALAHSHARGVVHRDLKPGNVLLSLPSGRLPSVKRLQPNHPLEIKLTDFGLAQALDRRSAADAVVAGTPAYMAPEQLQGRWRDQGPWTDLYSVGCLAWAMATGVPPFGKDQPFAEALENHLAKAPPAFRPQVPVPPGFEGWLRRLLAKPISERFPRAADAAWGLAQLSDDRERVGGLVPFSEDLPPLDEDDLDDEMDSEALPPADEPTEVAEAQMSRPIVVVRSDDEAPPERAGTPIPTTWRRTGGKFASRHLFGVGLNLFDIRPPPFEGRLAERDLLWKALREIYDTGLGRAIILRGSEGMGRTRLGTWFCQRADEVGAARVLTARHDTSGADESGLVPMVARYLRCDGLDHDATFERLTREFPPGDLLDEAIEPFSELLSPSNKPDAIWVHRFRYPRERYNLVRRLLEREATGYSTDDWEAVVVVWLDDAHLGSDTLDFCRFLLETQTADPVPVLLMISVQDAPGAAEVPPPTRRALEAIEDHPRCQTIDLAPLPEDEHVNLVRALLGMDGALAERVAARTAGSPALAVQLVGDWVTQGLLRSGAEGFQLADGAAVELPAEVKREWADRVERFLRAFRPEEGLAVELAAVLGARVRLDEWKAAGNSDGVEVSDRIIEALATERLVEHDPKTDTIVFRRTLLRDALLQRARTHARLERHHQAAAAMLESSPSTGRGSAERLGRHLLMSGHVVPALGKLLEGARERYHSGEITAARRLLEYRERALRRLEVPESDALWGLGWVEQAALDLESGHVTDVEPRLKKTEQLARRHGWNQVHMRAQLVRGRMLQRTGHLTSALEVLTAVGDDARLLDNPPLEARSRVELAITHVHLGQARDAEAELSQARVTFLALEDTHGLASCDWQQARIALSDGQLDHARELIHAARKRFLSLSARGSVAECTNGLGDVARHAEQPIAAEAHYREAMQLLDAVGHSASAIPRLNLGVVLVGQEKSVAARRLIEPMLRSQDIRDRPALAAAAHLVLLVAVANAGDWPAWDHHVGRAGALLAATGIVDRDNAALARMAAERAVRGGEVDRARSAFGLAWQQLDALGDAQAVTSVEERVRELA